MNNSLRFSRKQDHAFWSSAQVEEIVPAIYDEYSAQLPELFTGLMRRLIMVRPMTVSHFLQEKLSEKPTALSFLSEWGEKWEGSYLDRNRLQLAAQAFFPKDDRQQAAFTAYSRLFTPQGKELMQRDFAETTLLLAQEVNLRKVAPRTLGINILEPYQLAQLTRDEVRTFLEGVYSEYTVHGRRDFFHAMQRLYTVEPAVTKAFLRSKLVDYPRAVQLLRNEKSHERDEEVLADYQLATFGCNFLPGDIFSILAVHATKDGPHHLESTLFNSERVLCS